MMSYCYDHSLFVVCEHTDIRYQTYGVISVQWHIIVYSDHTSHLSNVLQNLPASIVVVAYTIS